MLIRTKDKLYIPPSEITNEDTFVNRRSLLKVMGLGGAAFAVSGLANERKPYVSEAIMQGPEWLEQKLQAIEPGPYSSNEMPTPYEYVTGYNNFYEFGTDKTDPAENSGEFVTDPWSVEVAGLADNTGVFNLEDLIKPHTLEERIYRLRCVEAWSMVVPWVGVPLKKMLELLKPTSMPGMFVLKRSLIPIRCLASVLCSHQLAILTLRV